MNNKEFIFVLVVTAIVVVIWAGSDIFSTTPSYTLDSNVTSLEAPFDPTFSESALNKINALNIGTSSSVVSSQLQPSEASNSSLNSSETAK